MALAEETPRGYRRSLTILVTVSVKNKPDKIPSTNWNACPEQYVHQFIAPQETDCKTAMRPFHHFL